MGIGGSRQDENMFLDMLSPDQRAHLTSKANTSAIPFISGSSRNVLKQKGHGNLQTTKKHDLFHQFTHQTAITDVYKAKSGHLSNSLARGPTTSLDGLYVDTTPFAFRPAEVAVDFHALDIGKQGVISYRLLGKALAKQFTRYDVMCTGRTYKLSATQEDLKFIWEYSSFRSVDCETYTRICYLMYRLPKIRVFPSLISYYLYDINYSQCLSLNAFMKSLVALCNASTALIKDKIREFEKLHRTKKKLTFNDDDFIFICSSVKLPAKKQHLIDHYSSQLRTPSSMTPLIVKYKLDAIAASQPKSNISDDGICLKDALGYFYSVSTIPSETAALTTANLLNFNQLRTKSFITAVYNDYQIYLNKLKSPLTRLAASSMHCSEKRDQTTKCAKDTNTTEEWSNSKSGSFVEVYAPLFGDAHDALTLASAFIPDTDEVMDTTLDASTPKISLCLNHQETLSNSENQSVIYSFEIGSDGRLRKAEGGSEKTKNGRRNVISQRLGTIPTIHASKQVMPEDDFEGDDEVIFSRFGSFCLYSDANRLQMIARLVTF